MARTNRYMLYDGGNFKNLPLDFEPQWQILSGSATREQPVSRYYATVGLLYRCVEIRASNIAKIPWEISRGASVVWDSDEGQAPDSLTWFEDWPDFLSLSEAAWCLGSNRGMEAFWFKLRQGRVITGLQWMAANSVAPQWGEQWNARGGLTSFKRQLGATTRDLPTDDVVYLWRRNPTSETDPRPSSAQAALRSAGVLYNIDEFVAAFWKRGAIKATILALGGTPSKDERDRIESWFEKVISGVRNAWSTKVVNADKVTAVQIGEGLESLSDSTLTQERRDDIATTMGVPHSLLFANAANYATAEVDKQNFYEATLIPDAEAIAKQVNKQLLEPLGFRVEFKPDRMSIFQADETARAQSLLNLVNAGVRLPIAAEMLGYDLPGTLTYADLEASPEPEPQTITVVPQPSPRQLPGPAEMPPAPAGPKALLRDPDWSIDARRFREWARKRAGRESFDLLGFMSEHLTVGDKQVIVNELEGDIIVDAPFCAPRVLEPTGWQQTAPTGWEHYP